MVNLCGKVHEFVRTLSVHEFPFERVRIPNNGIYVLFEAGEFAHGGMRIVRIGTHTGQNNLYSRLTEHFLIENKDRSIFRKNIGRALLNRENDLFLDQWNLDLTSNIARNKYSEMIDSQKLGEIERRVTEYIQGQMKITVIPVTKKDQRKILEARMISTVSLCEECGPSKDWLGIHSPERKIRESGLWQTQQLYKHPLSENEISDLISLSNSTL